MDEVDLGGKGKLEPMEIEPERNKRRPVPYVYLLASMAALNSANLGYDIGIMGGAATFIKEDWHLSDVQISLLVGVLNFCAIGGAAVAQVIIDGWGRRATFEASCCVFITGVLGMALAQNFAMIMCFRVITGFGVGIGFSVDPVYIAEVAPKHIRGELVTWSEISINFGIVTGFVAAYLFKDYPTWLSWRLMLGCGAIAPVVLFLFVFFLMPESPRWLVKMGRHDEARQVLAKVTWPDEDRSAQIKEIEDAVAREETFKDLGWSVIYKPQTAGIRRSLLVGIGVAGAQQLLAEESLLYYLPQMLEDIGVDRIDRFRALVFMGILKTLCIVVSANFLDGAGRRPMLLISVGGMSGCLGGLAATFYFGRPAMPAIGMIWLYMCFFSLGIGPVTWLLASEVFPLSIRAKAMACATTNNRVVSTFIAVTFLRWTDLAGFVSYFAVFATLGLVVWLLIFLYVPETKGRSLEAMAQHFENVANKANKGKNIQKADEIDTVLERTTESPIFADPAVVSLQNDINAV